MVQTLSPRNLVILTVTKI